MLLLSAVSVTAPSLLAIATFFPMLTAAEISVERSRQWMGVSSLTVDSCFAIRMMSPPVPEVAKESPVDPVFTTSVNDTSFVL